MVSSEDVYGIIKELHIDINVDNLNSGESLLNQGIDSLDMASIIFYIEDKWKIRILQDELVAGKWHSIDDIVININEEIKHD